MLFFITLLGFLLRISFLNKPEGLWNDEYVSWFVSSIPFSDGFWSEVLKQCHMPLYYLFLKPFAGCSDLILRLTSVLAGVLAIPVMYLIGKEFSKKCGIISALIISCLSFLVYYSQEVRFYSLLFLFSAILMLFTIKLVKNTTKKNLIGFIISSLLVVFTHVLGIIYVFFNFWYLIYAKKKVSLKILGWFAFLVVLTIPFGINILKMLPSSQWWGYFSYTNILFLFSDYLSPILTNNVNAPPVFFYNKSVALWMLLPCLICIYPLILGIKKFKEATVVSFLTVLTLCVLALLGKLVFITKYSIEILPSLILLLSLGFEEMKKAGTALLIVFISIHLASFFTPNYVTKIKRSEGNRIPAEILKYRNPDTIVFTYYSPERFKRYIDLTGKKNVVIDKTMRFYYKENPKLMLKDINKSETVSVVLLDSVSFFDENFVSQNINNPKIPEMFLTFSIIKNNLIKELDRDYEDFKLDKVGSWSVITARKK